MLVDDKDRMEFLTKNGLTPEIRKAVDDAMGERVESYCECGLGYDAFDMDGPDGPIPCIGSTPIHYGFDGLQTWTSTYKCPRCGRTFTQDESN